MPINAEERNAWYVSKGTYVGAGCVYSVGLNKAIVGQFTITWDDLGACVVECTPTNLNPIELFSVMGDFDNFRDLKISTPDGAVTAAKCYLDKATLGIPGPSLLTFVSLTTSYVAHSAPEAKYWNAPVTNLVSSFQKQKIDHPLRSAFGERPQSEAARVDEDSEERSLSRCCMFSFGGEVGFVEELSDYDEKKEALESGTVQTASTCMIVGQIPNGVALDMESVRAWFPVDALTAMSLASGTAVGLGFVELRDKEGKLHTRFHLSFGSRQYHAGPFAVSDFSHGSRNDSGLGALISAFLVASPESLRRVRLLVDALTTAKNELRTPEQAFSTIVRALDGLSNAFGLNRRRLLLELDSVEQDQVRAVLIRSRDALNDLARKLMTTNKSAAEIATIRRIASRAEQADAIEDSFGLTLPRLLQHYGLQDEQAISACYAEHPRYDNLSWPEALNKYRGGVIHKGFIDFLSGIPMSDVVNLTRHLIDLSIRICLKEIGYSGLYNPFNYTATQTLPVDWMSGIESAKLFGFDGGLPPLIKRIGF